MKFLRKNKKGFTLIEIIVVLVILAILAAALIPSMIGFVNDARGKALVAEARTVYVAGQSIATELTTTNTGTGANKVAQLTDITTGEGLTKLRALLAPDIKVAGNGGAASTDIGLPIFDLTDGIVTSLVYKKMVGAKTFTITITPPAAALVVQS